MLYSLANDGKLSGRADGNVYMRNGRIRGMKVPSLVQNAATQRVRNNLGVLSSGFRALSQSQISAWNEAKGFFTSDRFGRSVEVKGKTLYILLNRNLFAVGLPAIVNPPNPEAVSGLNSLDITFKITGSIASVAFSPDPIPANTSILISATAQLGAGISRPGRSAFRDLVSIDTGATSAQSIFTEYTTRFGALVAGKKVFVRVIAINTTTGQSSPSIIASTVITA